jgi:hypothetical protein
MQNCENKHQIELSFNMILHKRLFFLSSDNTYINSASIVIFLLGFSNLICGRYNSVCLFTCQSIHHFPDLIQTFLCQPGITQLGPMYPPCAMMRSIMYHPHVILKSLIYWFKSCKQIHQRNKVHVHYINVA